MSSPIQKLKAFFSSDDGSLRRTFECNECEHVYESAKQERRAVCPECLSNDVTLK